MGSSTYEGLLLGKAGVDRRDEVSVGAGSMLRLRTGNTSEKFLERIETLTMLTTGFQVTF